MLMREKASKHVPEAFMEASYMIKRLFGIIDDLFTRVPKEAIDNAIKKGLEYLRSCFRKATNNRTGPTEKDKYTQRKKLKRDKKRKIWFLKYLLAGIMGIQECPDCHSRKIKFFFKRERGYKDKNGKKIQSYSRVYRCLNRECRTKYFTRPPEGVELYSRVHRDVKKMVLRWTFHLRGSLSRVRDELLEHGIEVALTTVLRWIKKAGEECVNVLSIFRPEDWEQSLCIDEKWILCRYRHKIHCSSNPCDPWRYTFQAKSGFEMRVNARNLSGCSVEAGIDLPLVLFFLFTPKPLIQGLMRHAQQSGRYRLIPPGALDGFFYKEARSPV